MVRAMPHSPSSSWPFFTELLCAFMLLWCLTPLPVVAQTEQDQSRSCWGFLYCKETKGDTTWTEGFLWLYSTEERGTFSRLTLIPFYSREMDPATHYVRRSLLWPVAIAEHKGEDSYVQLLPFYWQAQNPARRYTVFAPLYFDYAAGDARYTHVIPLYGHHQRGGLSHRYYLLGPLAIATYDKETDLKEWDILFPLFHYGADRKGYEARVFPLYWAGETYGDGRWYRHLFPLYWSGGNEADGSWYRHILPLYGRSVTPQSDLSYVFPLYGSVTDAQSHETRTALVGLPPLPQTSLPTLALYEHASAPTSVSDRVFPLYRYAYAKPERLTELTMMVLFQMKRSPTLTAHRLFPLYSYEDDHEKNQGGWSFLGYDRFALTGYGHDPTQQWHQFLPLYRASADPTAQTETVDALGLGPLSFFRHMRHPDGSSHRFFPLYSYDHPDTEEWHWSALIAAPLALYRHDEKGTAIHDRFLPLYDWDQDGDRREFSMLGVSWFAMFYQESSPTLISHRLFPLYRYRHDLASDEVATDTLLLHRHHSTATRGTDRFLFLWDSTWQREQPTWELDVLGIKPLTLFHHAASSTDTADRLFPLYGYARSAAEETRLSILGFPPPDTGFSWSLYEQRRAPRHVLTRLFPLYRYERNDETKDVNWSALLLYRHTESETHLLDTFLPLHGYERDSAKGTAALNLIGLKPITLFKQSSAPDAANSMLFPLYDYDRHGNTHRLSLLGWPKVGTFPTLSLFERVATTSETTHRVFPLYRYNRNNDAKTLNWDALLWWHRETEYWAQDVVYPFMDMEHDRQKDLHEVGVLGMRPFTVFQYHSTPEESWQYAALLYGYSAEGAQRRFSAIGLPHFGQFPALSLVAMERTSTTYSQRVIPLYAYAEDDQNGRGERRFSALGLPHIGTFPALSLVAMEQTATSHAHRFLPFYSYAEAPQAGTLDWQALLLWWHHANPTQIRDTYFPLGSFRRMTNDQEWNVSALGIEPVSLIEIANNTTDTRNRFSPLWDYGKEGQDWRLSFVGIRQAALFSHEHTATGMTSHLFPLWWHQDLPDESRDILVPFWSDLRHHFTQERELGAIGLGPLSLYYQKQTPTGMTARLFPLWSYQHDEATHESRTSALGVYPLALYSGSSSPTAIETRLFPFFRYTSDLVKKESEFWFLWPLYDQKRAEGRTTEASFLWWLFDYRSPNADEWEYWVLGHPPMAMFIRTVSPTRTHVEINPIIPLWRRDSVEGVGTSWALLGGLIGMDTLPDGTHKLRLLWMSTKD